MILGFISTQSDEITLKKHRKMTKRMKNEDYEADHSMIIKVFN